MDTKQTKGTIKRHNFSIQLDHCLQVGFPCIGTEEGNLTFLSVDSHFYCYAPGQSW